MENKLERGEMASRERSKNQSKEINYNDLIGLQVEITYKDHVLFKNCDSSKMEPCIRKTVGWLMTVCNDHIVVCHDKAAELLRGERRESGFSLIKSDILRVVKLDVPRKSFKQTRPASNGQPKALKSGEKAKCKS